MYIVNNWCIQDWWLSFNGKQQETERQVPVASCHGCTITRFLPLIFFFLIMSNSSHLSFGLGSDFKRHSDIIVKIFELVYQWYSVLFSFYLCWDFSVFLMYTAALTVGFFFQFSYSVFSVSLLKIYSCSFLSIFFGSQEKKAL